VIYGFVGIFLLVPIVRGIHGGGSGLCILSAALMLAVLISPTMILFFSDSLDRVPKSLRDAADALGATPYQKLRLVMPPYAKEGILILFAWGGTLVLTAALSAILGYVILKGAGTLDPKLFFGDTAPLDALMLKRQVFDGLFPAIVGTLCLVVLAVVLAVPLGLATGIYLAEYAGRFAKKIFNLFFDILAGVPSIVVGLFGFALAVFLHRHVSREIGPCLLISGISLALLVLPYIIRTTQTSLEGLPVDIRLTALALGATRLQNIRHVLLPRSLSGIMTGVILAVGRCAEDTAVIPLTGAVAAGNR
jgi:phosphate transport system permease protein